MKKISVWVSEHIAYLILTVFMVALFVPQSFKWIPTASINPLLGIVMFGMGLTLKPVDFKILFTNPKDILIGVLAQFSIMPLVALLLTKVFALPVDIAIGVILVGCCPGGTASNVITYLARGNVALSVGMTGVSTLIAPLLTPTLVFLLAGEAINVDAWGMFLSILQVVILPILFGFLVNHYFSRFAEKVLPFLPMVSTLTISVIVGCIVSVNAGRILQTGLLLWSVVILHNLLGLASGYMIGRLLKLEKDKCSAITIEVGMQNSGLATSLAATHFAAYPMAAIPGAIFSVWHNLSGSVVASVLRKE